MKNPITALSPSLPPLDSGNLSEECKCGLCEESPPSFGGGRETHSLLPSSLLGIIRQWSADESTQEHIGFLIAQTEIQSVEIISLSRDLSEVETIHSSEPENLPVFQRFPGFKNRLLGKRALELGTSSTFSGSGEKGLQFFYQVGSALDQGRLLLAVIGCPRKPEDPFFSTTCHIVSTLLLNEVKTELTRTALIRSEQMLQQSQRLANMGQLTTGVAHDFNNLLTVIQGHIAIIENECSGDKELEDSIERISSATSRAVELSRQLLSLGKEQEIEFQTCDLNQIIRRFKKLIARMLEENIEVSFDLGDELGSIDADSGLVTQILMNLVVNARDAMPQGGKIKISTRLIPHSDGSADSPVNFISLRVKDNGAGIPEKNLSRIFEPFFSTKDSKGTGLGLANVAAIMQKHGGRIDVSSEVGLGTEFELLFPQKSPHQSSPENPSEKKPSLSEKRSLGKAAFEGVHVLLVEDEKPVRKLVRKLLEMIGCTVTESPSGKDALERWPALCNEVSLVVSDVMMPGGVSGWELARQIHRSNPELGILLTSGYSERPEDHGLEGVSEVSFLQKPYDIGKLKEELQALALAS